MNDELRAELLRMQTADIAMRRELVDAGELYRQEYHPRMAEVHRKNNTRMREIVEQYGWPGRGLVGDDGCEGAWFIMQHAVLEPELREHCVELLRNAVAAGDAPARHLALLTDSVLFGKGEPQIYGCITVGDGNGGAVLWETEDLEHVDERRKEVGLPPLEENMKRIRGEINFVLDKQREGEEAIKKSD